MSSVELTKVANFYNEIRAGNAFFDALAAYVHSR